MSTFFLFGNYHQEALQKASEDRTVEVVAIIQGFGGKITGMYAMMGAYDLVLIVEMPSMNEALQASIAITKKTAITFSTLPAVPIEEFDRLVGA